MTQKPPSKVWTPLTFRCNNIFWNETDYRLHLNPAEQDYIDSFVDVWRALKEV